MAGVNLCRSQHRMSTWPGQLLPLEGRHTSMRPSRFLKTLQVLLPLFYHMAPSVIKLTKRNESYTTNGFTQQFGKNATLVVGLCHPKDMLALLRLGQWAQC